MRREGWPSVGDYWEAILDPDAIGDAELRGGTLERNPGGRPRIFTGTSTATFHFETVNGGVAFRCYVRGDEDLGRRYSAIADVLRYARIEGLCKTQYLREGIRVDDAWWPAVKMDWVAGRTLNAEVEARLNDPDGMLALATRFRETVRSLGVLGIAHGDLQPANIMVTGGELRLIDYDAMFLPAIADLPQTEYGHRNFQHPQRRTAEFDGRLDRFSSIVIYTALVALATDRRLWARFNEGDNLLFRAHDFTSQGQSDLFRILLANNATSGLADVLNAACRMPVADVPTLESAITAAAGTMPAFRPPAPPPRPRAYGRADTPLPPPPPPLGLEAPRGASRLGSSRPLRARRGLVMSAIALAGIGIGFAMAAWPHGAAHRDVATKHATVAYEKPAPKRQPTPVATAKASTAPVPTPTPAQTPTLTKATPTKTLASTPTPVPSILVTPASGVNPIALQGSWQIAEANVQNGTMLWSGDAVASSDGTIVLDAHKDSIAGRSASQCERRTNLHAAIKPGVSQQTVPFQETNCQGGLLAGEVRVSGFSPDGRSFSGTFWQGGTKLGDFTASKQ